MTTGQRRALRSYRNMPPSKFHSLNRRVRKALTANPLIPDTIWAANPGLLALFFALSDQHDAVFHEALLGSIVMIAQREAMQAQLIIYLDEIASLLEAASVRYPDLLLSSGFDLAKERRSSSRPKPVVVPAETASAEQTGSTP
jgi:hypothetical protein